MARLLFILLTLLNFGCKDTSQNVDVVKTFKGDNTSIVNFIRQIRQQTLLYLDTMIGNDSKRLVRFHSSLDSSTFQTLQNWIFHNENKIQSDGKEVLNLLDKSHIDSILLSKYDTTLFAKTSKTDRVIQIHFNGFALNSDATKIATVVGIYFGDEGELITGWREFLVFKRQGNSFTISQKGIVVEY